MKPLMNNGTSSLNPLNQSLMDCQLSCTSQLPWILVIDTLSRSNQVDISLLLDLLQKTPEISGDLGRNVREMLSLRIIESFSAEGALSNPVSSPTSQKVRVDPSDRCEDVLRRILTETSSSHLKPAGPEMSKWDLKPFVERKRSSLPKCALQQLKDAIFSGNHSCFASLKEQSGLPTGNPGDYEAPVDDSNRNGITPSDTNNDHFLPRDFPDENLGAVNTKRKATSESAGGKSSENDCETHIKSFKKKKRDTICNEQTVGEVLISSGVDTQLEDMTVCMLHSEGIGCNGITPNNTNDDHLLPRDLPDENLVAVNRKKKATSESAGGKSSENDYETHVKSFKKQKYDINCNEQSVGEVLISLDADTQLADRTVSMQHYEGKGYSLGRTHSGGVRLTGPDDNNECTSLKGLVGTDTVLPRQNRVPHSDTELNNKPEEEREQDHSIEEPKGDMESFRSLEQTNEGVDNFKGNILENVTNVHEVGDDNYLSNYSDGNSNDKTAIVRKSNASCFSQYSYREDSLATNNRRDQNVLADSPKIHGEEERYRLGEKTDGELMGQNEPSGDCNNRTTSSKGRVVHNEVLTHEKQVHNCGTVIPNDYLDVEKRQDHQADDAEGGFITSDKDMGELEQIFCRNVPVVCEAEQDNDVPSDSDGYHDERTSIDAKKKTFLSSQCTHSRDSLASTDWRELKHCLKCNKGGKLLVCSSNSCPVVIHESCLDSDQIFDPNEIFYCPFCAYNRAISEYMKVKKKASLARKDLRNFICLKTQQESKAQSQSSCKENRLCI